MRTLGLKVFHFVLGQSSKRTLGLKAFHTIALLKPTVLQLAFSLALVKKIDGKGMVGSHASIVDELSEGRGFRVGFLQYCIYASMHQVLLRRLV